VASPFNAELYLRLAGEQAVLDPPTQGRPPWDSPLGEVGAALSAIGVISVDLVQDIIDDYQLAVFMRSGGRMPRMFPGPRATRSRPKALTAARVVACDQALEQPWGRLVVHYVSLGEESTSLAITAVESAPGALMGGPPMGPGLGFNQAQLTDDQGATEIANFNGGGSPGSWQGHLTTGAPLSRSTRWIDVGASRILLPDEQQPSPPVTVERLASTDPAERYLRLRLATTGHGPMVVSAEGLDACIDTLVAAGALDHDSPVVGEARAVAAAFGGQAPPRAALPAPWASLLARRGASSGPTGTVAIGAVTPEFDGVAIRFDGLLSNDQGFQIQTATSPGIMRGPFGRHVGEGPRVAWWAEDDRANHYLGSTGNWGGSPDLSQGTINYWPPLDPRATALRLTPTGLTERAIVTVGPLRWTKRR